MELRASVKINEGNFDDWKVFYDSYQIVRHRYVSESVKKSHRMRRLLNSM